MECCCPRLSPWWKAKVTLALLLVAQALVLTLTGWFAGQVFPLPLAIGQGVVLVGALLTAWHYALLKRPNPRLAEPEQLVTSGGLYRRVRHPMYLGDFVVIVGLALLCPTWLSAVAIPTGALCLFRLARYEDARMEERFGREFEAYQGRSRLLLPFLL